MGDRGKVTDPVLLDETLLTGKEIDQGAAYFQLQHMLDTRLSDADRFPLKAEKIRFMNINEDTAPLVINWQQSEENRIHPPMDWPIVQKYYQAVTFSPEHGKFTACHMYVDPAGGGMNGDETAYAVTKLLAGKIFLVALGGVKGGLDQVQMDQLTDIAVQWKPNTITIEENYGKGALSSTWQPTLFQKHKCEIIDEWVSGQKELRIIDTLEPIIGAGKLVCDISLLESDWAATKHYPINNRASYSFWYQLSRITRDKGALIHDDRLEAVAASCRYWLDGLKVDEEIQKTAAALAAYNAMMKDPLRTGRQPTGWANMNRRGPATPSAFDKTRRRF